MSRTLAGFASSSASPTTSSISLLTSSVTSSAPYVEAHAQARTPNPCIACNAHLKFGRFLQRAPLLGFDAIATGHHARVTKSATNLAVAPWSRRRQGPVLRALHARPSRACSGATTYRGTDQGTGAPGRLRPRPAHRGKPDSQDVCFISKNGGRASFVGERIPLRDGRLVSTDGDDLGAVDALELVTVGQRGASASTPSRSRSVAMSLASTSRTGLRP